MEDPLAMCVVDVILCLASSFFKKICSDLEVSQVSAGNKNVVDDVLEPTVREVKMQRSHPHDCLS